jgi:hypothetical protein
MHRAKKYFTKFNRSRKNTNHRNSKENSQQWIPTNSRYHRGQWNDFDL